MKFKIQSVIFVTTFAAIFLLLSALPSFSQNQTLKFKHITVVDGLSYNSVKVITQDYQGYIWCGTDMGLNKYDGSKFTVFKNNPDDSTSISSNVIKTIFEDSDKNLWIGNSAGLELFDRSSERFTHFKKNNIGQVNAIYEDKNKNLWIGTLQGEVFFLDKKSMKFTLCKDITGQEIKSSITYIYEDKKGTIWVATENEVKTVSSQNLQVAFKQNDFKDLKKVSFIYEDSKGLLWFATNGNGLISLDGNGTYNSYKNDPQHPNSLSSNVTFGVMEKQDGKLWVGTENGGLNFFDPATGKFSILLADRDDEGLSSNTIYSIFKDKNSNTWIGTNNGGINFLKTNKFDHYKSKVGEINGINNDIILSLAEDKSGNIWIGTDGGGLNFFDRTDGKFHHFTHDEKNKNSISNNFVTGVSVDSEGNVWMCFWDGGVDLYDRKKNMFIHHKHDDKNINSPANNSIWDVMEDRDGDILMATIEGLDVYDRKSNTYTHYTPSNSNISNQYIFDIFQDSEGLIWVGTVHGFNLFDKKNKTFTKYLHDDKDAHSISDNVVSSIMEDSKGRLWLGTQKGVNVFDKKTKKFTAYREKDGLSADMIAAIAEDNSGNMWISTTNGISMLDTKKNSFTKYQVSDGLQASEFKRNSVLKTAKGELMFGGIKGYNIFIPEKLKINSSIPPVVISNFKIFNKPVEIGVKDSPLKEHISQTKEVTLSYKHSIISFDFVALDYVSPEKNQYAYKMEGLDKDWIYAGTNKSATYTYLEPGEYTFKVKASNNDGIWNEEGVSLKVIITPPFWKTLWFKTLVLVLIIGGAVTFYKVRMNAIKAQKEELEKQVTERTAQVNLQKEELKVQAENLISVNSSLQQKQEEIEIQRDNLKKVNEHVMSSIKYANTIQKALLPSTNRIKTAFKDFFVIYRPKDVVSGDFYWFSHIPKEKTGGEEITIIAAVDCTGHGVPGAFMSIIGSTLLNEIVNQKLIFDPARILTELNAGVKKAVEKAEGVNTAGMDVSLCVLEKVGGDKVKLLYGGAKRPLYYVSPGKDGLEVLEGDRKSIGSESGSNKEFSTQELVVQSGSFLYLTTDGYSDQNNIDRTKFGSERLKEMIVKYSILDGETQKKLFEESLDEFQKEAEQRDDITLIGVKI